MDWQSFGNVYNDISVDQRSVDWFLLGYEEGSKNHIKLIGKGEGALNEMSQKLSEEKVAFGYLKVYSESNDPPQMAAVDYVHITFIGKRVKAQERARAVIHSLDIHQAFPRFTIEFEANSLEDLSMERLRKELKEMQEMLSME